MSPFNTNLNVNLKISETLKNFNAIFWYLALILLLPAMEMGKTVEYVLVVILFYLLQFIFTEVVSPMLKLIFNFAKSERSIDMKISKNKESPRKEKDAR